MIEVLFLYETQNIIIQCNTEDKLKDVAQKLKIKINEEDNDDLFYVYEGDKINEELTIKQIIKNKSENQIKILVFDSSDEENEKKIVSNEIICPICKENILIKIRDYQIDLYGCKNQHKLENVLLYEFENSQKIDLSKIICGMCTINNRSNVFNHNFFVCNNCEKNLCPLCKAKHDSGHNIIRYNDKNYICKNHNDKFIQYCEQCKKNICFLCKSEHNNHSIIELGNLIPNKEELLKVMKYMRQIIDKFKNNIEEINKILNKIKDHFEIYYKLFNNIINNYNFDNRNYQNYYNINEIKNGTFYIIKDLTNITKENNINNKFQKIIDIYYKIIKTKKTKVYENGDKYTGEFVNDLKYGKGVLFYSQNNNYINRYEGDFKNDKKEGKGIFYLKNGDRYVGDFKDNKCEGKGVYYWRDGRRYEGDWKNNKKEGKGIYYWKNGDRYEGDMKEDKREGKGKIYYSNGDIYEGYFKNNIYEGKGIYYWKDGRKYDGDWKNQKKEGKGIFYFSGAGRYEGDWKGDKREGAGVIYYNNGDREMGDFLEGKTVGIHAKLSIFGEVTQQDYGFN